MARDWAANPFFSAQHVPAGPVVIDRGHPLAQGLLYCALNRGPGDYDLVSGVKISIVGGAPQGTWDRGQGIKLDGSTQAIITNRVLGAQTGFTIVLYWYADSTTFARFASSAHTDVDFLGFQLRKRSGFTDRPQFDIGNGTTFATALGPTWPARGGGSPPGGSTVQIGGTYDNANLICYVDGVGSTPVALAGPMAASTFATGVGYGTAYNGDFTKGTFGPVMIWNRALSAGEMALLALDPHCMLRPAMVGAMAGSAAPPAADGSASLAGAGGFTNAATFQKTRYTITTAGSGSTTWPVDLHAVDQIELWGAGGSGGRRTTTTGRATGGGAGAYVRIINMGWDVSGGNVSYRVGAGGPANTTTSAAGSDGQSTWLVAIGTYMAANGGAGQSGAVSTAGTAGTGANSVPNATAGNNTVFSGGAGGTASTNAGASGGGGAASPFSNGVAGTAEVSAAITAGGNAGTGGGLGGTTSGQAGAADPEGGGGGAGSITSATASGAGGAPGGGSGGYYATGAGAGSGKGGDGQIYVTYTIGQWLAPLSTMAGAGGLTANATHTPDGSATLAGASGFTNAGTVQRWAASALLAGAGDGALTGDFGPDFSTDWSGGGIALGNATHTPAGSALLAGAGGFTNSDTDQWWNASSALLAGAGGFSANATHTPAGSALLAGAGAFTATQVQWQAVTASLAGSGGFTSNPTHTPTAAAAMAGAGGFVSSAEGQWWNALAGSLVGVGGFTGNGDRPATVGSATLAGSGSFVSSAESLRMAAVATLAGAGGFVGTTGPVVYLVSSVLLAGAGSFTANATHTPAGSALLAGAGTFTGAATHTPLGSALLNGAGLFTSAEVARLLASALLAGAGTFTADATIAGHVTSWSGGALLAGAGGFTGNAIHTPTGAALLAGAGGVTNAGTIQRWTILAGDYGTDYSPDYRWVLAGAGTFTVNATHTPVGAASLAGSGSFVSSAELQLKGAFAALAGAGAFTGAATHTPLGVVLLAGAGAFTSTLVQRMAAVATPAGAGTFTANTIPIFGASALLLGSGTLSDSGVVQRLAATAPLIGNTTLVADADPPYRAGGSGLLAGAGGVTANAIHTPSAAAVLAGAGGLAAATTPQRGTSAALAGAGAFTGAALWQMAAVATLSGDGSFTPGSIYQTWMGRVVLAGAGLVQAEAGRFLGDYVAATSVTSANHGTGHFGFALTPWPTETSTRGQGGPRTAFIGGPRVVSVE